MLLIFDLAIPEASGKLAASKFSSRTYPQTIIIINFHIIPVDFPKITIDINSIFLYVFACLRKASGYSHFHDSANYIWIR